MAPIHPYYSGNMLDLFLDGIYCTSGSDGLKGHHVHVWRTIEIYSARHIGLVDYRVNQVYLHWNNIQPKMWLNKLMPLAILASHVTAVTQIPDDEMNTLLDQGGVELADRYAPMWFFGQSQNQVPCYPTWAFGGSPTAPDTYDDAHKTPPAGQCQYPGVGCKCRSPDVELGNPGPDFPIYYTYQKCGDAEVRMVYNLFYEKDGAQLGAINSGHD